MSMEIHREISAAYRLHGISRTTIVKWRERFQNDRTDLTDARRQKMQTAIRTSHIV